MFAVEGDVDTSIVVESVERVEVVEFLCDLGRLVCFSSVMSFFFDSVSTSCSNLCECVCSKYSVESTGSVDGTKPSLAAVVVEVSSASFFESKLIM